MKINKIAKVFFAIMIISIFAANEVKAEQDDTIKSDVHWCKDEVSIWGGGGWSVLHYRSAVGIRNNHLGGLFGIGYTRNFSQHWGILLGVEAALYRSSLSIANLSDNYNASDLDPYFANEKFNFRYRINNYEEKQYLWNVNIPVALQFQTPVWTIHKYYISLGFKLGIPIVARYESSAESIESYGFYPKWNQVLNEPEELGFGKFGKQGAKGKLNFGLAYTGTFETGLKWRIGNAVHLYTGVYLDYAFNDIVKNATHNKHFVDYNSYHDGRFNVINSALESQYTTNDNNIDLGFGQYSDHNGEVKALVGKVLPISVGIKLRLSFGCPDPNKKADKKKKGDYCCDCEKGEKSGIERSELLNKLDSLTEVVKNQKAISVVSETPVEAQPLESQQVQTTTTTTPSNSTQQELAERRKNYIEKPRIINYDLNVAQLNFAQKDIMDYYVRMMLSNPKYTLLITGHTCDLGSNESNFSIGLRRALGAKMYLIQQGISPSRIITFTAGEEDPIVPNNSDANRKRNRRLEFGIINN